MKYDNQLRYAVNIIKQYDGRFPLSVWLKDFFRENKQMGSRDRRTVSHLVYSYYRLGHSHFGSTEERVLAAVAICGDASGELLDYFKPVAPEVSPAAIFPWAGLLSDGIDAEAFSLSFLKQSELFLRVRPGNQKVVLQKLAESGTAYRSINDISIALANTTKADSILQINKEVVIQDLSSQKAGEFISDIKDGALWDCCAASGGKSIMAYDLIKNVRLTASDIRQSIINNLHERFKEAGIKEYNAFVADLSDPAYILPDTKYDAILADVPCSGSGTWARTPEQLYFFKTKKLSHYTELQRGISTKVIPALKPGGVFIYITCSVFKSENEEAVKFITENSALTLSRMEVIKGYGEKADTMFAARFVL